MVNDPFLNFADSPTAPSRFCVAIEPNDTAELTCWTKAIYVGEGGNVALVPSDNDQAVVFRNVPTGSILDVRARAVLASGTTAGHIIGLC